MHLLHDIRQFDTVSADILDRRGTDIAGNQRQVLGTPQVERGEFLDQPVPTHAGVGMHAYPALVGALEPPFVKSRL